MSEPDRRRSENLDPQAQLGTVSTDTSGSALWHRLMDPGNEAAFASAWLALQCSRIPGAVAGLLLISQVHAGARPLAVKWPEGSLDVDDLRRLAELAAADRRFTVAHGRLGREASPARPVVLIVALPLGVSKEAIGVISVALTTTAGRSELSPQVVAEQIRWGAGWLEALPWTRRSKDLSSDIARAASCLDLVATVAAQPRLKAMTMALTNELATRLRCDRVSLGVIGRRGTIRLQAVSHSANFRRESRLADTIEDAMDEAVEQRGSVAYPMLPALGRAVTIAHRALAESGKAPGASSLSVVLAGCDGESIGALTFERHCAEPFSDDTLRLAEALAALLGPQIALRLRANRFVSGRIIDHVVDGYAALLGPRRPGLKLAAAGIIAAVLVLVFAKGEHRVTAKAVLEAELQRAAVAPFDGFIRAAPIRAGDTVRNGDLLAALDDRELALDRLKWRAERDKLRQRHREALAKHDRSNLAVIEPQIWQAETQLALAEEKLTRARILAPFDGIAVSGDLSQMLGSPVEKGKTLFEIAPLDAYRLIIQVDERDVGYIAVGQTGTVALAGRPGDLLPLTLTKITPVTVAEGGRNAFRVEARPSSPVRHLRPGMEGIAKIEAGPRSIAWIWTHAFVDWLELVAWRHLP